MRQDLGLLKAISYRLSNKGSEISVFPLCPDWASVAAVGEQLTIQGTLSPCLDMWFSHQMNIGLVPPYFTIFLKFGFITCFLLVSSANHTTVTAFPFQQFLRLGICVWLVTAQMKWLNAASNIKTGVFSSGLLIIAPAEMNIRFGNV